MFQKTYHITDVTEDKLTEILNQVAQMPEYLTARQTLLVILEQNWDPNIIQKKTTLVKRILPQAEIAGITHYDHLLSENEEFKNSSVFTFFFFEQSSFYIHRIDMRGEGDQTVGRETGRLLRERTEAKCLMTFFAKDNRDTGLILKEIQKEIGNVPIFGAAAGMTPLFRETGTGYVFDGDGCYQDTLLAVLLCGDALHVKTSYNCGWRPVGKTMTISGLQDEYTVTEIDHRPAAEMYERYLGIPYRNNTLYIENICEFPLTIEQNGLRMARIPYKWTEDGKLCFQITVHRGEQIRLSYSLPQQIFSQIFSDAEDFGIFGAQGMLMVVCMNRMIFLREQEHYETDAYRKIAPGAAFLHGNSEIYFHNGAGGEMHSALIAVGFREGSVGEEGDTNRTETGINQNEAGTNRTETGINQNEAGTNRTETGIGQNEANTNRKAADISRNETYTRQHETDKEQDELEKKQSAEQGETDCPAKPAGGQKLISLELRLMTFLRSVTSDLERTTQELLHLQHNLEHEVEKKTRENESLSLHVVQTLAEAIDAKDTYTNGHSGRVAVYSREIARRAGYTKKEQDEIYMMGLLHDVGKIGVPDAVINKPARLTDEEFEMIKNHPVMGARILGNIKEMPKLVTGARWHHERYDGHGYPDGLSGTDIPEEARIIGVADAYDAMTSNRSYRRSMDQSMVREQIEKGKGTQFDPRFADIMLRMIDEDAEYRMREI